MRILAIKINLANTVDYNQFINSIQFDIKRSEMYFKPIQSPYTAKQVKGIEKKLDQIYKNEI